MNRMNDIELNREACLDELNDFDKKRPNEISPGLEDLLSKIAKTGDTLFPWTKVKSLVHKKLEIVMSEFYESCPTDSFTSAPNVDVFKYDALKEKILEAVESFQSAPFTIQRICELITSPKKHYKRTDKFMRGLEKNILVVSTIEPSSLRCSEVNNNGNSIVNGVLEVSTAVNDLLASPDANANTLDNSSVSIASSCMDSNFTQSHSIMNGTSEENNSPATSSASSPSSSMMMFTTHQLPSGTTNESESSSSSDSDSSTDSLTTEFPKSGHLESGVVSTSVPSPKLVTPIQTEATGVEFVASNQACSSRAAAPSISVTSEGNDMDTTPGGHLEPEEGVSSSNVSSDLAESGMRTDEAAAVTIAESARILIADSTDGNTSIRTSTGFGDIASDASSSNLPESSIADPGLSLGDELSVVKEVAENLVETLLSQSDSQMAMLQDTFVDATCSSTLVNSVVTSEVTSRSINVPEVSSQFGSQSPTVESNQQLPEQSNLTEKQERMETDLNIAEAQQASSSTSTIPNISSASSSLPSSPLPINPSLDGSTELTLEASSQPLPDQSEPMEED